MRKGGRRSAGVTPGRTRSPLDPGCQEGGKREFKAAGSRPAAERPSAARAKHSRELG